MKISTYYYQLLERYHRPIIIPAEFPSAWETFRLGAPALLLIAIWFYFHH